MARKNQNIRPIRENPVISQNQIPSLILDIKNAMTITSQIAKNPKARNLIIINPNRIIKPLVNPGIDDRRTLIPCTSSHWSKLVNLEANRPKKLPKAAFMRNLERNLAFAPQWNLLESRKTKRVPG